VQGVLLDSPERTERTSCGQDLTRGWSLDGSKTGLPDPSASASAIRPMRSRSWSCAVSARIKE
jgi:hypothetical protein